MPLYKADGVSVYFYKASGKFIVEVEAKGFTHEIYEGRLKPKNMEKIHEKIMQVLSPSSIKEKIKQTEDEIVFYKNEISSLKKEMNHDAKRLKSIKEAARKVLKDYASKYDDEALESFLAQKDMIKALEGITPEKEQTYFIRAFEYKPEIAYEIGAANTSEIDQFFDDFIKKYDFANLFVRDRVEAKKLFDKRIELELYKKDRSFHNIKLRLLNDVSIRDMLFNIVKHKIVVPDDNEAVNVFEGAEKIFTISGEKNIKGASLAMNETFNRWKNDPAFMEKFINYDLIGKTFDTKELFLLEKLDKELSIKDRIKRRGKWAMSEMASSFIKESVNVPLQLREDIFNSPKKEALKILKDHFMQIWGSDFEKNSHKIPHVYKVLFYQEAYMRLLTGLQGLDKEFLDDDLYIS